MLNTAKKAIDIISEFLKIGKTTAKDIQIAGDIATARKIKKAIEEKDVKKVRRIISRGGIFIDESDIIGIFDSKDYPAVLVSIDFMVRYRIYQKEFRRLKRREND